MYFIGVTTGQSTMTRLFPFWATLLGLHARLVGVDLPLQAPIEHYREAVAQIKYDPLSMGALITTHKINLFNAAEDLFMSGLYFINLDSISVAICYGFLFRHKRS
jgi:shikimate 5-dehydrogenase